MAGVVEPLATNRGDLDGRTELRVDQSGAPIRNEAGEPLGVVVVFRDVTEKCRAEARRFFLAEASRRLASLALDYEGTLESIAKLAVPDHADWCLVDLAEPDGSYSRAAVAHLDPARASMAAALEHDVNELQRQEQLRRDLVANVSHELATPLTAISGFTEALLDGMLHSREEREETPRGASPNL